MPHYFFDIDDGNLRTQDGDGLILDGPVAACREAMMALGELARDELKYGHQRNLAIVVRTIEDRPIFRADLTLAVTRLE